MPTVRRVHDRVGVASLASLQVGDDGGSGPTIVLLHGLPAGAELWRDVLERLGAAGRTAIAPDLPGYGRTTVPPTVDHSPIGAAELLAAWLRRRDAEPVWLVGHDLGGVVAQLLAVRHRDLVGRLTLGDCPIGADGWPVAPIRLLRTLARAGLYDLPAVTRRAGPTLGRALLRTGFADPARLDDGTLRRVFADGKVQDGAGRRAFARHLRSLDPRRIGVLEHELADLRIPTQLVWAADDGYLPFATFGTRLRDALPDPAVTVVDGAGHFLPLERPAEHVQALTTWSG